MSFTVMGCFVTVYNYVGFHLMEAPYLLSQTQIGIIFMAHGSQKLFGLFGALLIILGLLRPITGTTLMPVGFILLGLLLAGFQAWTHYSKLR